MIIWPSANIHWRPDAFAFTVEHSLDLRTGVYLESALQARRTEFGAVAVTVTPTQRIPEGVKDCGVLTITGNLLPDAIDGYTFRGLVDEVVRECEIRANEDTAAEGAKVRPFLNELRATIPQP